MSRNLKVLVLALVAVFALSAIGASAAFAESTFTTTSGATITGNQPSGTTQKFTFTGQSVVCPSVKFHAVAPSADFASLDVAVNYSDWCSAAGFSTTITNFAATPAEIGKEGKCWWTINANGSSALKCNKADVTIDATPCVIHIPAQSFASGFNFANTGTSPDDIDMSFNITGIKATHTDGVLCPFGSSGESNEGVFEGESTMIAEEGERQVNLTWDE
jgi:hypothetical protein